MEEPMHEADWYATFCHLAGVSAVDMKAAGATPPLPPVDSINLWPLISGNVTASPRVEWALTPFGEDTAMGPINRDDPHGRRPLSDLRREPHCVILGFGGLILRLNIGCGALRWGCGVYAVATQADRWSHPAGATVCLPLFASLKVFDSGLASGILTHVLAHFRSVTHIRRGGAVRYILITPAHGIAFQISSSAIPAQRSAACSTYSKTQRSDTTCNHSYDRTTLFVSCTLVRAAVWSWICSNGVVLLAALQGAEPAGGRSGYSGANDDGTERVVQSGPW